MSVMGTVDMIKAQNIVVVKANYRKPITVSAEVLYTSDLVLSTSRAGLKARILRARYHHEPGRLKFFKSQARAWLELASDYS